MVNQMPSNMPPEVSDWGPIVAEYHGGSTFNSQMMYGGAAGFVVLTLGLAFVVPVMPESERIKGLAILGLLALVFLVAAIVGFFRTRKRVVIFVDGLMLVK